MTSDTLSIDARLHRLTNIDMLRGLVNALNREFLLSHPGNIAQWEFREPRALSTDRFRDMQPQTVSILNAGKIPDSAYYADLVTDGRVNAKFYMLQKVAEGFAPIFKFHSIEIVEGSLRLAYPGSDSWAAIWLGVLEVQEDRPTLDFSRFDTLVLELRADTDGTAVSVHIKDRFLPDTEAPHSITLQITYTWRSYNKLISTGWEALCQRFHGYDSSPTAGRT